MKRKSTTRRKNPVAKFARRFNKTATFRDRKKALKRGDNRFHSSRIGTDTEE